MNQDLYTHIIRDKSYIELLEQLLKEGHKPIIVALGGSHAYGTNVEGSDVDLRGIYLNNVSELIGSAVDKEQYVSSGNIDVQLYSLKKAAWLLKACNPAVIEILGCRNDDYAYVSIEGRELIQHLPIFLSKKAIHTFGGYAANQLNRLVNRSGRSSGEILNNEQRSFEKSFMHLKDRYSRYIDQSAKVEQVDNQLYLSFSLENCPVGQVGAILNEFNAIDRDYRKSVRNEKATAHGRLAKHMMHLIRLYMMGTELMKECTVHTYREGEEHELLMAIRRGEFLELDGLTPTAEFNKLLESYQVMYQKACETTKLPDKPDENAINDLLVKLNSHYLANVLPKQSEVSWSDPRYFEKLPEKFVNIFKVKNR